MAYRKGSMWSTSVMINFLPNRNASYKDDTSRSSEMLHVSTVTFLLAKCVSNQALAWPAGSIMSGVFICSYTITALSMDSSSTDKPYALYFSCILYSRIALKKTKGYVSGSFYCQPLTVPWRTSSVSLPKYVMTPAHMRQRHGNSLRYIYNFFTCSSQRAC